MGRKKKENDGPKTNFTLPANVIQANAQKDAIKKLNQEFQMAGGTVSFKTTKKGQSVQLSHNDPLYLENFRLRLFHEMGLSTTSEDGSAVAAAASAPLPPTAIAPAGVRGPYVTPRPAAPPTPPSSAPVNGGAPLTSGHPPSETGQVRRASPDTTPQAQGPNGQPQPYWPRGPREPGHYPRSSNDSHLRPPGPGQHCEPQPRGWNGRGGGFQRHLGFRPSGPPQEYHRPDPATDQKLDEIITSALKDGVIDDGQIIKYAYLHEIRVEVINELRKRLMSGRCNSLDKKCPYKRKQMRFEEVMKSCCGVKKNCDGLDSDMGRYFEQWYKNVESIYSEFRDKEVVIIGKISSAKFIERESEKNHYKLLIYDTLIRHKKDANDLSVKPKDTRKIWAKLDEEEFNRMNRSETFKIEDIVKIEGTIVWNDHFFDYWIVGIKDMKVLEKKGEMPIRP